LKKADIDQPVSLFIGEVSIHQNLAFDLSDLISPRNWWPFSVTERSGNAKVQIFQVAMMKFIGN